ncbi:lipoprotein NlpI [Maioricimonas rarisocia]|uniref:Lipoprotein NlpI n=1 Tax=Maioricimonas rarisocia TaxID=2528026 RepID=A0A517ZBV6_9PLAN|nr:tetratricopeptide repeat protein [Maioricimonas rarisocia]QDU39973.1 lipoprotein NlpI [Maioricimonas rarisocia]
MSAATTAPNAVPANASHQPAAGSKVQIWLHVATLLVLGGLPYLVSLDAPFTYDDTHYINDAQLTRPLSRPTQPNRPLIHYTLVANYRLDGLNPRGYRLANVIIHLLTGLALYGLVFRTLTSPRLRDSFSIQSARTYAWVAALLWVVHPLNTQSVTYVIQRCESLMGLFYVAGMYCFARGATADRRTLRTAWFAAVWSCWVLSSACKEVAYLMPVVVVAFDWLFFSNDLKRLLKRHWGLYAAFAAPIILVLPNFFWRLTHHQSMGFAVKDLTWWEYARTQPQIVLHYLGLALVPVNQCFDSMWPVARSPVEILLPGLVIGMMMLLTAWGVWSRAAWSFLGVWFFVVLAPSSGLVAIRDLAQEHRMYLPLAAITTGLTLIVGNGVHRWLSRPPNRPRLAPAVTAFLVGTALLALSSLTVGRNELYNSELQLWADTARKAPHNYRAWTNVGLAAASRGDYESAIRSYDRALSLEEYSVALANRAAALNRLGKHPEAIEDATRAISRTEGGRAQSVRRVEALARQERGLALFQRGQLAPAVADFEEAARLQPRNAATHYNLGLCRFAAGDYERAVAAFTTALKHSPSDADAHYGRGLALLRKGEFSAARRDLAAARKLGKPIPADVLDQLSGAQ